MSDAPLTLEEALLNADRDVFRDPDAWGVSAASPSRSALTTTALRERRLVTLLLSELQSLALPIGAATSVVNRLEENISGISQDALVAYLPPEPCTSTELAGSLVETNFDTHILSDLQDFHARLATARSMTLRFDKYPAELRHKGGVHIEVLAGIWRDLCEQMTELICALQSVTPNDKSSHSLQRAGTLKLLSACANGGTPCVMSDGSIEVPGLAERRRQQRWMVDWPVTLALGTMDVEATIVNISLGGFCLRTSETLQCSEGICVELQVDRRLSGQVVWSKGQTYGIQLATPLTAEDPIIIAAQSRDN